MYISINKRNLLFASSLLCTVTITYFVFIQEFESSTINYEYADQDVLTDVAIVSSTSEVDTTSSYSPSTSLVFSDESLETKPDSENSQAENIEFSSVSQINEYLLDSAGMKNEVLGPLIKKFAEDSALRQAWLNWLLMAENNQVVTATEILLGSLPISDLQEFASDALVYGQKSVVEATIFAFTMRDDLDVVNSGLKESILNVVTDESVNQYSKIYAMEVLSKRPEFYDEQDRTLITQIIEGQLVNEDAGIQAMALNAMIKLEPQNPLIEVTVMSEINDHDFMTRRSALEAMDYRLELGLQLSPQAVSLIHQSVMTDLVGESNFEVVDREQYIATAGYVLGQLNLTENQRYEIQAAGITL